MSSEHSSASLGEQAKCPTCGHPMRCAVDTPTRVVWVCGRCEAEGGQGAADLAQQTAEQIATTMLDDEEFCWNDGGSERIEAIILAALKKAANG